MNPAFVIENSIKRLNGYREVRRFTADHQVLKDTYNYLGDGFFDQLIIMGGGIVAKMPMNVLEELCRHEYRRCGWTLPAPSYIVG